MTKLEAFMILLVSFGASAVPRSASAEQQTAENAQMNFNAAPWLEDFRQLLREMSSHYADLEWAVEERGMNLASLRAETEAALLKAHDATEARRILERFVAEFGDGHLGIEWQRAEAQNPASGAQVSVCQKLGYARRGKPGIDFALLAGFSPLAGEGAESFPGGLLKLASGKLLAVIRIEAFSEKLFPAACEQVARELSISDSVDCNEECADKVEKQSANVLTAEVAARADALRRAGATAILIDIARNGGGSNWVEAVSRALSSRPLQGSRMGFLKHPHWTNQLQDDLKEIDGEIEKRTNPDSALRNAAATLQRAIEASKQPCDRTGVWLTGKFNCSLVVKDLLFASGVLPYAAPGSFAGIESRTVLFKPLGYEYSESRDRLPLYVLVDGNTWSAAEYFAVLLQDNRAGTVIGEITGGAGCGYTNGGIATELANSRAVVKMPDCVRFRADGSNEVGGVTPDILVPWAHRDTPYQRAKKLLAVLQQLPALQ